MLPIKDLRPRGVGEKVMVWDGKILEELEGLPGGRPWEAGTLLSDRVGICDRQACGGLAGDWCPSKIVTIAYRYS